MIAPTGKVRVRENGRITLMWRAFDGPPAGARLDAVLFTPRR